MYLVQLRHLRELGTVPVSGGKAQPDPGEVTLDCFYLIFSSPCCWALSKHQAHITVRFHSPPYTLSVSSGFMRLRFNTIRTTYFPHKGFWAGRGCSCVPMKSTASKLCSNSDWDNNNNIPGHRDVEDKLPEANETSHLNTRSVRYILLKKSTSILVSKYLE